MTWTINLSSPFFILVVYGIIVNIVTFFYFGLDKMKSMKQGARRIRERTLWFLIAIGGSVGAILGMHVFRHKTKKLSFQAVVAVILLIQIWLVFFIYNR